jgi:hypothetical protein
VSFSKVTSIMAEEEDRDKQKVEMAKWSRFLLAM